MGIYAERSGFKRVLLLFSDGLDLELMERLRTSLLSREVHVLQELPISSIGFEQATETFQQSPPNADAVIGFGGGKALDVAEKVLDSDDEVEVFPPMLVDLEPHDPAVIPPDAGQK